jgi:DNA-binding GntR family transcriptional regulator
MVTIRPRRGAAVTTLSTEELDEIIHLRQNLESDVLAQAIPRMTPERIAAARAVLDEMVADTNRTSYSGQNWRFHSALYSAAAAPLTLEILHRLHRIGDRYLRNEKDFDSVDAEHRTLLDLVAQRRKKEAIAFLKVHIGDLKLRFGAITVSTARTRK